MHPAAQATIERVLGIEWKIQMLDFDAQISVCVITNTGEKLAVRFDTRKGRPAGRSEALQLYADEIDTAKEALLLMLQEK